jgi:CRISPR-associated endonuclease Csn1
MAWRLGCDLGTNSLGWCAVEIDANRAPIRLLGLGSRIFSDGRDAKSKQSLAVDRREARAARRRRDRFKQRQAALLKHLTAMDLFPPIEEPAARAALEQLDPFALRARALHAPLTPYELGRALFHLNQRRGFKSNRRTDRAAKQDGKIDLGVSRLRELMRAENAATFGEFLHNRRAGATDLNHVPTVRTRLRPEMDGEKEREGYDFYPDRAMLEEEFDAIMAAQQPHHPDLLATPQCDVLFDVIFHQRDLKPPKIGMCTLVPGEERLPKAHPLFQRRRLLEELNALRIVRVGQSSQPLSREQRDLLLLKLKDKKEVSFKTLRQKVLRLPDETRFNKESENRAALTGDEVAAIMSDKRRFGPAWSHLSLDRRCDIVSRVRLAESDLELTRWLTDEFKLTEAQAQAIADAPLPEGFGRFGITATTKLIAALEADVVVYSEAVDRAGLGHHSDFRTGEVLGSLPYYGQVLERHIMPGSGDPNHDPEARFGRLTNPTVHIGLNQLRRVVNALIRTYGPPEQIALEIARDLKMTEDKKKELAARNKQNRDAALLRSAKLDDLNQADKGSNRAMLKLWEELNQKDVLDRRCIYSGTLISAAMLFSGEVEVDHILPFSATLDDSQGNLLLCLREENRKKKNKSPHEAFGHTARWPEIAARAARLPREKRWRFEPDAMKRFDETGGFLDRQLHDTQHLSRLAGEYLRALYPGRGEGSSHVWVSPGRLTEMLRRSWGLNSLLPDHNLSAGADQPKNRLDHRHHAIDAAVVAVTDRGLLQRISHTAGQRGAEEARRVTADLPQPWDGFREELQQALARVVASHRADHGTVGKRSPKSQDSTAGRLHNDTAYGLTGRVENGLPLVVHRIPFMGIKPSDLMESGRHIADQTLREALANATAGTEGKSFLQALMRFSEQDPRFKGIRHVRVVEPLSVIPIRDSDGNIYKAYKGDANHRYDVWEIAGGKWVAEVVSRFDAHQPGWTSRIRAEHHNARKVLSLQIDDIIALERDGQRELLRVVKFSAGQLVLAAPNQAGDLKRRHDLPQETDPFRYVFVSASSLKSCAARQIRIDELGRVQDPGARTPMPAL